MGETETPHFHDFEVFEPVPEPQNQCLSGETPRDFKKSKKKPKSCLGNAMLYKFQNVGNLCLGKYWKRWAPTKSDDTSSNILKILDMRSTSSWTYETEIK